LKESLEIGTKNIVKIHFSGTRKKQEQVPEQQLNKGWKKLQRKLKEDKEKKQLNSFTGVVQAASMQNFKRQKYKVTIIIF
jgi:hypothetical protein